MWLGNSGCQEKPCAEGLGASQLLSWEARQSRLLPEPNQYLQTGIEAGESGWLGQFLSINQCSLSHLWYSHQGSFTCGANFCFPSDGSGAQNKYSYKTRSSSSVKLSFVSDKNASSGWLGCPALTHWDDGVRELSELGEGKGVNMNWWVASRVYIHIIKLHIILLLLVVTLKYTIWCHFSEGHCSLTAPQRHIYTGNCSHEPVNIIVINKALSHHKNISPSLSFCQCL